MGIGFHHEGHEAHEELKTRQFKGRFLRVLRALRGEE
jgi:hypothetical protein